MSTKHTNAGQTQPNQTNISPKAQTDAYPLQTDAQPPPPKENNQTE